MVNDIEIRKVDAQGRIVLPLDWREREIKSGDEVVLIKEKGYLKIVAKKRGDLTKFFDSVTLERDLNLDDGDWDSFEEKIARKHVDEV
ncbi:MAG: AbrB/MazE/SpoVT family DNA-binding domain-containing protein [Candidatus Lokiarchaeota archaeon]|nr:AbrB/MazE/SpoVT family DNA-binding domain-containing protein [Candidatus Lokiarchaeota archaeon]